MFRHLYFHKSGKPRGWFRAIAISKSTLSIRPLFLRAFFDKNGMLWPDLATFVGQNPNYQSDVLCRGSNTVNAKAGANLALLLHLWLLRSAARLTAHFSVHRAKKFERSAMKRAPRLIEEPFLTLGQRSYLRVPYRVLRSLPLSDAEDVLILVLFSGDGALSDLQRYQVATYMAAGYKLVVVVNTPAYAVVGDLVASEPALAAVSAVILRDNCGFDFSAWGQALQIIGGLSSLRSLSLTNDSILPLDLASLILLRERTVATQSVLFLTESREIRPHAQSYFFAFGNPSDAKSAFDILSAVPIHLTKKDLVKKEELYLSKRLKKAGYSVEIAFSVAEADRRGVNPTISYWQELLRTGFPFLKLQLFSAGRLSLSDPALSDHVSQELIGLIECHLKSRISVLSIPALNANQPPRPAFNINSRFMPGGAMQAFNPPIDARPAILLPLMNTDSQAVSIKSVLVVLHAFYVDSAERIVRQLTSYDTIEAGARFRFVLTTDTEEKAKYLHAAFSSEMMIGRLDLTVMVCENRGRDVAPFLVACSEHLREEDLVLHVHTKKSPQDPNLQFWGEYLFDCLFGSVQTVRSISQIFDAPQVGLVYPGHFGPIAGFRNWGFDYEHAARLLERLNCELTADQTLDFPTGTMFWARPAALRNLLDLQLTSEAFEQETGQVDGTLAHAIERCLIHVVENSGYTAQAVIQTDHHDKHKGRALPMNVSLARTFVSRVQARLRHAALPSTQFDGNVPEVYGVAIGRSAQLRPRFNILVPTVQPEKIYGGVSTALGVAAKLHDAIGPCDVRFLVISDGVDTKGLSELARRFGPGIALADPQDDAEGMTVVPVSSHRFLPLSLRADDRFMATAWWTADLAFRLRKVQVELFGAAPRLVYLIQDYEPGFYSWSDKYAMAMATYERQNETIALINSEELANFMTARRPFVHAFCIPYTLEPQIAKQIKATVKERIILVYGRPSVSRNCFGTILEGLRRWQSRNPRANAEWSVAIVGEEFNPKLVAELENVSVLGKLSLNGYSDLLNRASIGISMMVSPHPSYPPLEMASAGLITITNSYENKDLSRRAENIISLNILTPDSVAEAINQAVAWARPGEVAFPLGVSSLASPYPILDYKLVAELQANRCKI